MTGMTSLPAPAALLRPLLLGVVSGARSQLGLAVLAWSPSRRRDPAPLRLLRARAGCAGSVLAVAGELVADKLPRTPSRLSPPVLGGRLAVGALVGALAADRRDPGATGLSATAGSWAPLPRRGPVPDRAPRCPSAPAPPTCPGRWRKTPRPWGSPSRSAAARGRCPGGGGCRGCAAESPPRWRPRVAVELTRLR